MRMVTEGNTKQKRGTGAKLALHSPSAIRLLKSQPAPTTEPLDPREFLHTEAHIRRRVYIAAAIVVIALAATLIAGTATGIVSGPNLVAPAQTQTSALTTHGFLEFSVMADGWDAETSTCPIARLRPEDSEEYTVCRAVPANTRDIIELDEGRYYLSWITPVDADGTLYIPPEGETLVNIQAGHTITRPATFTRVPVVESTFGDYAATIDIVWEAMAHGDETLTGEAGEAFMRKLQENANEAPNFFIYVPEEY
ncbi:MAG: hypothetical protein E7000_02405 [Coriobacteriaceae bacterium]|nr:hypothetical protein [Coriobacteriaceae bacterium]